MQMLPYPHLPCMVHQQPHKAGGEAQHVRVVGAQLRCQQVQGGAEERLCLLPQAQPMAQDVRQ